MIDLFLAVALAGLPAAAPAPSDVRVIRRVGAGSRFVRTESRVTIDGVAGTQIATYDIDSGRFVQQTRAGALSNAQGFDGEHLWSADASGMATLEGNAMARAGALAMAHFFGRRGPERFVRRRLRGSGQVRRERWQFDSLPGPIEVAYDAATGAVRAIDDRSLSDRRTQLRFGAYRRVGNVTLPLRIETIGRYDSGVERVVRVERPRTVPARAFAPPPPPHDTTLAGVTSVPLLGWPARPVVAVRLNGGPELRMLFDTGGSNVLTPRAARRLHLRLRGSARTEQPGSPLLSQRFAIVRRMRIGRAELRDQSFAVITGYDAGRGVDGSIGSEVLARFAVRFDFLEGRVDLARDVNALRPDAPPIPMHLAGGGPEADGGFDGFSGPVGIDTGSDSVLDVMSPFVRAHRLPVRYHARELPGTATGGALREYRATAGTVRIGPVAVGGGRAAIPIVLQGSPTGAFADPTEIGNLGMGFLFGFVAVFDVRGGRLWLTAHDRVPVTR